MKTSVVTQLPTTRQVDRIVTSDLIAYVWGMEHQTIGPYTVHEEIGRGGFSTVYRATTADGRLVALKVVTGTAPNDDLSSRLRREGAILIALDSPYIVKLVSTDPDHDPPYIAFDFVNGVTLERAMKDDAATGSNETHHEAFVRSVLVQALQGLKDAHAVGIIHRDIKPANIMLKGDHTQHVDVVLLDFGIAKPRFEEKGLTQEGFLVGTPQYMAPEQLTQDAVDASTDLYSLGLVIYELLSANPAFDQKDTHQIVRAQLTGPIVKLPANLRIDQTLRTVVNKMCNRERSVRYSSASDALAALDGMSAIPVTALRDPSPIELDRSARVETPRTPVVETEPMERPQPPPLKEFKRSGNPLYFVIGLIALVGVGYLVFNAYGEYRDAKLRHDFKEHKTEIEFLHEKQEVSAEEYDKLQEEIAEEEARLEAARAKKEKKRKKPKVRNINKKKTFKESQQPITIEQ